MNILDEKEANIDEIVKVLKNKGLIMFPCETVYGVAVDAHSDEAVKKLSAYKQRPLGKPYAVMVNDQVMAEKYVSLNQTAKDLYKTFLPGPVTIISNGKHQVAAGVESESGTLGVRIPDYKFMLKLINKFGRAIVATSANASYQKRPYKIQDVLDNISIKQRELLTLAIDAGELPHNEPSTVIDTTLDDAVVLRQGDIRVGEKNEVLSRNEENTRNIGKELWQKYEQHVGQRAIVFALEGEMGSGKTQFTKGLAKAMGIDEEVVSPTYNLELEYIADKLHTTLEHIDAWRMQNSGELEALNLKGLILDRSVIVIEWADRVVDAISKYNEEAIVIWVKIEYADKETERKISWGVLNN